MHRFKTFGAVALAGALALGAAATVSAQDMKFWRIGTGGAGGTYFPIGGLIANAISNPPGSRPCDKGGSCGVPGLVAIAVSTNASVANVNAIDAGQLDAGLAGAQSVTQGYNGEGKFDGNPKKNIRVNVPSTFTIGVSVDPNIMNNAAERLLGL
ncbi:MAG: TAXI family TRAP transporter solute-binding subunit, partial [Pseudomonadota bacterium]